MAVRVTIGDTARALLCHRHALMPPPMHRPEITLSTADLHHVWLFEAVDDANLAALIARAETLSLARGATLFRQDDRCQRIYLLAAGQLKLYRLGANGDEKVVDFIHPGQTFAEAVAFLDGSRMPVSATALAPARVFSFDSAQFLGILRADPELSLRVLGVLSRRLHQLLMQVEELTLHNSGFRLANFLLEQPRHDGDRVILDVPKYELASRLSITPETLSRIFHRFMEDGLIQVHGDTLRILDAEGLTALIRA